MLPTAQAIADLQAQVAALTTEKGTLTTQLAAAQQQAQTNFADLTASREEVTALTAQVGTLTTERDTAQTALAAEIAGRPAAIEAEVVARLAAAGTDPVNRGGSSSAAAANVDDLSAQLAAITDPAARTQFYRKNQAALMAAKNAAA